MPKSKEIEEIYENAKDQFQPFIDAIAEFMNERVIPAWNQIVKDLDEAGLLVESSDDEKSSEDELREHFRKIMNETVSLVPPEAKKDDYQIAMPEKIYAFSDPVGYERGLDRYSRLEWNGVRIIIDNGIEKPMLLRRVPSPLDYCEEFIPEVDT